MSSPSRPFVFAPDQHVACNVCGTDAPKPLFRVREFQIVECDRCGLAYTNPRLAADALREVYASDYFRSPDSLVHGYVDYRAEKANIQRTFRERWRIMRPFLPARGRLLDVGCAYGFLLEIARDDGWDVAGIDTSAEAVRHVREALGVEALQSDRPELPFPDASFDAIAMWDVIEHLEDPAAMLQECADKLRPGGLLSLITPDQSSLLARVSGRRWVEYHKPHEHLYFFSRRLMRRLLERAGFEVVRIGTAGKHVEVGFALDRLAGMHPLPFRPLAAVARWTRLSRLVVKINPRDKMFVLATKRI